jgi:AraC-like DNA-binding protein
MRPATAAPAGPRAQPGFAFPGLDDAVPIGHFVEMLEHAARATGDDCLGLHLGSRCGKPVGRLPPCPRAPGDATAVLRELVRHPQLLRDGTQVRLLIDRTRAELVYSLCDPAVLDYRHAAEMWMASAAHIFRTLPGRRIGLIAAVHFEHPRPEDTREHRRLFGVPPHFWQPHNALVIRLHEPAAPAAAPFDPEHPGAAAAQGRGASADLVAQVRRLILMGLRTGKLSIQSVSGALQLNERTLQRRLDRVGSPPFQDLVENVRRDLSCCYLRQRHLSLTEIGQLLGYAEPSVFSRAFRRWTGLTPRRFRSAAAARDTMSRAPLPRQRMASSTTAAIST